MTRLWTLVLVVALSAVLAAAFYDFEQITVDSTAGGKGFTTSKILPSGRPPVNRVECRLRTAEISVLKTDPSVTAVTSSVGMLLEPGDLITLTDLEEIRNFRAIRTTATSGQLDCSYRAPN